MARAFFKIYFSSRRVLMEMLDDTQRGRVVAAAFDYAQHQTEPNGLCMEEQFAFEQLRVWIDYGIKTYDNVCERNRENGLKGGRPRAKSALSSDEKNPVGFPLIKAKEKAKAKTKAKTKAKAEVVVEEKEDVFVSDETENDPPPLPPAIAEFWIANGYGNKLPRSINAQICAYTEKGCAESLIIRALERGVEEGKTSWSYAKRILDDAVTAGTLDAESFDAARANRRRPASGRNVIADRAQPSGNDFLKNAIDRPRRIKRKD